MADNESLTCPKCGSAYKANAFGGQCPQCLMAAASAGSGFAGFEVLPPAELNAALEEFDVTDLVGRGGMGAVYRARETRLDREVAIKLLAREAGADPEFAARFAREAQVTAKLDHPSIVPVYGVGYDALGRCYYSMRLVRGRELGEIFQLANAGREGWNVARAVAVMVRVCQAVAFAHGKGVVHRDLKPSNIMVGDLGEVYIMDWGLAKMAGVADLRDIRLRLESGGVSALDTIVTSGTAGDSALMTMDGSVVGTPAYMPPEQALSRVDEVDHLSDIYSLGAVLYELLAGHAPYSPKGSKSTPAEVLSTLSNQPPTRVHGENAKAPAELVAVCEKAMARRREDRYPHALDLAEDLQAWLDGRVVGAHGTGALIVARKWVGRNRALATASVVLTILGLLAVAVVQFVANRDVTAALGSEQQAKTEALATLAESFAKAGFEADKQGELAKAALLFERASAVAPHESAQLANRVRTREWSRRATRVIRAFSIGASPSRLDLSPDGRFLRVASEKGWQVFDVAAEKELDLAPPGAPLTAAAWSPDGSVLAVASSAEPAVLLYELPTGTPRGRIPSPMKNAQIAELCFSRDGSVLAAGGDGGCFVWSLNEKRHMGHTESAPGTARVPVDISPDHTRLLATDGKDQFCLFALHDAPGETLDTVAGPFAFAPSSRIMNARQAPPAFLADGRQFIHSRIATIPGDLIDVVQRDSTTGAEIKVVPGFDNVLALDASRRRFLGYRKDSVAAQFDARTGERASPRFAWGEGVRDFRLSGDGSHAILGSGLAWVPLYSTADGAKVDDLALFPMDAVLACLSHDASLAVTAQRSGELMVFALNPPPPKPPEHTISLADYCAKPESISSAVALHPGGKLLALSGTPYAQTFTITRSRVFEIAGGQPAGPVLDPGGHVLSAEFSPDGETLAMLATIGTPVRYETMHLAGGHPGTLQFWDWKSGKRLGEPVPMPSEPRSSVFIRHGAAIAVYCAGGQVVEIDRTTHAVTQLFRTSGLGAAHALFQGDIACSPDGSTLLVSELNTVIHAWDIAARRPRFDPLKIPFRCTDVGFLPVATGPGVFSTVEYFTDKPAVRFYDTATGKEAARPIPVASDSYCGRFGPDGSRFLYCGTRSNSARLYDWRTGTAICPEVSHGFEVFSGAFVPDSSWCLTGDQLGRLYLWDGNTGRFLMPAYPQKGRRATPVVDIKVTPDSRFAIITTFNTGGIRILDLRALREEFPLDAEGARLLAEINAAAWVHPGGDTVRLDPGGWMERWQAFRRRYPAYHLFPGGK
ncbi:MAG TPA: hypothetical protein DIT64_21735 [Verrucomicrobiales bacterium]|nr:hypothetical protein [Verrucomicrobiales bacterium]